MDFLKRSLKRLLRAVGFELFRRKRISNSTYQLLKGLDKFEIDLILDVGANAGQFASRLRSFGYNEKIVSFEPLSDAFELLSDQAADDAKWQIHRRGAIGDFDGEIEINISGNSVSSSVLPMMKSHSSAAIKSAYIGLEKVPIFTLDTVAYEFLSETKRCFLKIDVQGYEWQVLDGARETLAQVQGVLCELSLVPLYEGQRLWLDVIQRLEQEGFTLWALQKGFTDPRDGRTLQVDAIFFRETKIT